MNRRNLIKNAAFAGAGSLVTHNGAAVARPHIGAETPERGNNTIILADGTSLFFRDWGAGEPVLFLAGWALPSDFWGYQMLDMARSGYRTIAYDRRGHGRSSDPGRGYNHDTLADDLAAVIDTLDLRRVTLVGHSMAGTEIARYFARHDGRNVARVVLVGPITPCMQKTPDNPDGLDPAALAAFQAPIARDFPGWLEANEKPFFMPETPRSMVDWVKTLMLQTSLLAAAELAKANAETDFRADVRRINVPTLVVHGNNDASAPLALTGLPTSKLINGARLSVYEDAPHGLPLTHADRLNAELRSFIQRI